MDVMEAILVLFGVGIAFFGGLVLASIRWMAYIQTQIEPLLKAAQKLTGGGGGAKLDIFGMLAQGVLAKLGGK